MTETGSRTSLFDDNPTTRDLLGFDGVATAVVRVLLSGGLDPVTVGVQGPWGGGKSTVLNLVADKLEDVPRVLVVRVDPWEFENVDDVRGTLISLVLNALQVMVTQDESEVEQTTREKVIRRLDDLRRRIAWGRVATVLVTSAATMSPDIPGLIEALTPAGPPPAEGSDDDQKPGKGQTMAGFRDDFAALMSEDLGLSKVVVLVDDLDRCLPKAIVGTIEAIKLFLSVKGMSFVLAADEDLIRAGIDAHLGGLADGDFAARYMEKIVQIPISLPVLTQQDAEAYVALLLAGSGNLSGLQMNALVSAAQERRRAGTAPYVVAGDDDDLDSGVLALAATAARVLSADMWSTPRAVKRFLNNLAIRDDLAIAAGAQVPLDLLLKMYLLELRHLPSFTKLAALPSTERDDLLQRWEAWGRGEAQKPDEVDERTQAWARVDPALIGRGPEIDRYLSLAATLRAEVRFGGALDPQQRQRIEHLMDESDTIRRAAVADLREQSRAEQEVAIKAVADALPRAHDPQSAIQSLADLAAADTALVAVVTESLSRRGVLSKIEPHHVLVLSELPDVLTALINTDGVGAEVVAAAREEMTSH
jgi:hypothetical protein